MRHTLASVEKTRKTLGAKMQSREVLRYRLRQEPHIFAGTMATGRLLLSLMLPIAAALQYVPILQAPDSVVTLRTAPACMAVEPELYAGFAFYDCEMEARLEALKKEVEEREKAARAAEAAAREATRELNEVAHKLENKIAMLQNELDSSKELNKAYSEALDEISTITTMATNTETPQVTMSY